MGARSVLFMQSCTPRLLSLRLLSLLLLLPPFRFLLVLRLLFRRRRRRRLQHHSALRLYLRVVHLRHRGTANSFLPDTLPSLPLRGENLHARGDRPMENALPATEEGVSRPNGGGASRFRSDLRTTRRDDPIAGALHHGDGASRLRIDLRTRRGGPVGARPPRRGRRRRREDRRRRRRRGRKPSFGCSW